jgi:hypothetical protein
MDKGGSWLSFPSQQRLILYIKQKKERERKKEKRKATHCEKEEK